MPELVIIRKLIEQKRFMKLLDVNLDECITWKDHTRTVKNNISENIGLLYGNKQLLNTSSLKKYLLFIYSYIS